jgi:4-hydroxy-4-methyl-2-oxoglutarate aldolase
VCREMRNLVDDNDDLGRWSTVPTAVLSDETGHQGVIAHRVRARTPGPCFAGRALTIRVTPEGSNTPRDALRLARPGCAIVIDATSHPEAAVWGGNLTTIAQARGVRAVIVDGFVRDIAELSQSGIAVYSCGVTPVGPQWTCTLEEPVHCGGQSIAPGDLLVGDADGVVVVGSGQQDLLLRSLQRLSREEELRERVRLRGWPSDSDPIR